MKKPIKCYEVEYITLEEFEPKLKKGEMQEVKEQFYWCESIGVRCAVLE